MSQSGSLAVAPAAGTDSTAPADAAIQVRADSAGRSQVRLQVSPEASVDPADPKPAPATSEPATKVEDKPADAVVTPQRPAWLPAKFETPDAMKTATVELARKQGAPGYVIAGLLASESGQEVSDAYATFEKHIDPNAGKPAEKVEDKPKEEPAVEKPAPVVSEKSDADKAYERETYGSYVATMLDTVGIRAVDMATEFQENGNKLTPTTYEKFAKAGVTKAFLDSYISGMVGNASALAEAGIKDVKASVGGDEAFGKLAVWGSANMTKDQHEIYTSMTNSGSVVAAKQAVKMLKGWYDEANGTPPVLVTPTVTTTTAPKGYGSNEEMMADMNDPRYQMGDKAFHRQVEEKLKHTNLR